MQTPDALIPRIARVRSRLRVTILMQGVGWLLAAVVGLAVLAGIADWTFHFDASVTRVLVLAGIGGAGGAIVWRLVARPLLAPMTDADIAMQIERRFPGFDESLASSVQFLKSRHDPSLGSPALQERVIDAAARRAAPYDFAQIVNTGRNVRAIAAATGVAVVLIGLGRTFPYEVRIGARRLLLPFSHAAWPRQTDLRLLTLQFRPVSVEEAPLKVVRGRPFELFVQNVKGRLPDDVELEYRMQKEPPVREPLRHIALRGGEGVVRDVCLLSLPSDRGLIRFRVTGGDDATMPEYTMVVVPPPSVETLKVTLTPPAYLRQPRTDLAAGDGRARGVVGTQVSLQAQVNKPLTSVNVLLNGKPAGVMKISDDARGFFGSFTIAEPGTYPYSFRLMDKEGIESIDPPRYEIQAAADLIPEVTIDQPAADATVTSSAELPIVVSAKDDFGLRDVRICFGIGDSPASHAAVLPLATNLPREPRHKAGVRWRIADLHVSDGMRIVFHAEATDWFDLGLAHIGRSPSRTLTVVSSEQKEAEIIARQTDLLRLLERADKAETGTRQQTQKLQVQLDTAGGLRPPDLDMLKRMHADQREVHATLAKPEEGAAALVDRLLEDLRENQIASPTARARLQRFQKELADLGRSHLPKVDEALGRAIKAAEVQRTSPNREMVREQSKSLKSAGHEQGLVLKSLRSMLSELARLRDWHGVEESVRDIVETQEKLNGETATAARSTLGKPLSDLGKQDQADLAALAERQSQAAEQIAEFKQRLHDATKAPEGSDPDMAERATATLRSIARSSLDSKMREIGGQLARNGIGEAMASQQGLLEELRKLEHDVARTPERDPEALVGKMAASEKKIDALRKDQETLRKQTQHHLQSKKPNPTERDVLREKQDRLREAAQDLAILLRQLGSDAASEETRSAGAHMAQAEEGLDGSSGSETDSEQKMAADDLERARSELGRARRRVADQLAHESFVRIADELVGLAGRQKTTLDETVRLDRERSQRSNWSRGQLKSLAANARLQRQLQTETDRIADRVKSAEIHQWALRQGAAEMKAAADRLGRQLTDVETVAYQSRAWTSLQNLVGSFKSQSREANSKRAGSQSGGGEQNPSVDGIPPTAQLVLLKSLQEDLLRRTAELDRRRMAANSSNSAAAAKSAGDPSEPVEARRLATEQAESARLAAAEGELAALFERILSQQARGQAPASTRAPRKDK
jgi:hypothetical protein